MSCAEHIRPPIVSTAYPSIHITPETLYSFYRPTEDMLLLPYLLMSAASVVLGRKIGTLNARDDVSQCAINCIVQSGFSEGCTDLYVRTFCA